MPVNNATYMGQCWVVIHHKRGDPFTLILSIRFYTIQIFMVGNITKLIEIGVFTVILPNSPGYPKRNILYNMLFVAGCRN